MNGSSHRAELATYPGSGYYQDLTTTAVASKTILADLKNQLWIDRGTRAAFVDFTVFNPNVNLFCVARYVADKQARCSMSNHFTYVLYVSADVECCYLLYN